MFSRISKCNLFVRPVRKFSVFDKMMNDPKVREQAAAMLQNPEVVQQWLGTLKTSLKDGEGGMSGMLLRNSPVKSAVEKMGGYDNLERMLTDPATLAKVQEMMKDPAMVAKAAENMDQMMKNDKELPGNK